jgi:hypothetical protein
VWLFVLAYLFTGGISLGLHRIAGIDRPLPGVEAVVSDAGLILRQNNDSMILLTAGAKSRGPRVVAFPDKNIIYEEKPIGPDGEPLLLPSLSLKPKPIWLVQSIRMDLRLCAEEMRTRLNSGLLPFTVYLAALILLLVSVRFVFMLSHWPLANIFLGLLVYRGIFALAGFLSTPETLAVFRKAVNTVLPTWLFTPVVFCALSVVLIIYTLLAYIVSRPGVEDA